MFAKIFIFISFLLMPALLMANETCTNIEDYTCYEKTVKDRCDANTLPWNKDALTFGNITTVYARLATGALNEMREQIIETTTDKNKKEEMQKLLSESRIGMFNGIRTVEIARLVYRNNMDNIFACAVIAGRLEKIMKMRALNFGDKQSEIMRKLEKEERRYTELLPTNCIQNLIGKTQDWQIRARLMQSVTREYCRYRHYLEYIDANYRHNFTNIVKLERAIGTHHTNSEISDIDGVLRELVKSKHAIEKEIIRARDILPKALTAYKEMERTYPLHLILIMIYDEYITLRNNLNNYLTNISQLFTKAFNAQDANQR